MNRGFILFVQKNNTSDYLKQAVACSLSIKKFMPDDQICLMTDIDVPENYKKHFDHIQDIPGLDLAVNSEWKVNNRCKIYTNSPFEQSIVLDVDMLLLENIEHWWEQLSKYELYYTDKVKTYRNEWVSDDYYRKVFVENSLPNVYCGFHYFKKCKNNNVFLNKSKSHYSSVAIYSKQPHIDGYVSKKNIEENLKGSASLVVSKLGSGRVILFADNPNFRGTWYGTNKLFLNGIFYGANISVPE